VPVISPYGATVDGEEEFLGVSAGGFGGGDNGAGAWETGAGWPIAASWADNEEVQAAVAISAATASEQKGRNRMEAR